MCDDDGSMSQNRTSCRAAVEEAARRVYKELGSGFVEQVCRDAMAVEFRQLGLQYEVERNIEVFYRGECVGLHRLDFIVERSLVVELKAAAKISEHNFAQTRAYLKTTALSSALVINFPSPENDQGPEIQVVATRPGSKARSPKARRQSQVRRRPTRSRRSASGSLQRSPQIPDDRRRPLDDLVWDADARRYVDKHSGPVRESDKGTASAVSSEIVPQAKIDSNNG